eukprot:scaffold37968_cov23-Tisochrysis_lutea.AAC.1
MDAHTWNEIGKGQASSEHVVPGFSKPGLSYTNPFKAERTVSDKRQYSLQKEDEGEDAHVESMEDDGGGGEKYNGGEIDGGEELEGSVSDDGCENAEV